MASEEMEPKNVTEKDTSLNEECENIKESTKSLLDVKDTLDKPECNLDVNVADSQKENKETMVCPNDTKTQLCSNSQINHPIPVDEAANLYTETVNLKVVYKKQKLDITFPLDKKISDLKSHIQTLTNVPSAMQKVMYKGLAKDESTLRECNMTNGAKLIVIGSTINDVLEVATPSETLIETPGSTAVTEPLCKQKVHQRVLEKHGKPEDANVGIKNIKERLPQCPLSGMYNKTGGKVRLTFKLELDQLWIGTKERTEKIPMNSIKAVVSEPIVGSEEYHLMGIQLGPTEASRYWVYWVPAQYIDAIREAIFGKWQF